MTSISNSSYSNYLNIYCNYSKEISSLIDKTSNQNTNTPFTQSTRQDTQNIEYNSSKAFQEVSKQNLDNIINDNHDDFQSSILENFLDSLNYCTIGAIMQLTKILKIQLLIKRILKMQKQIQQQIPTKLLKNTPLMTMVLWEISF